jgi:hypothetical protein
MMEVTLIRTDGTTRTVEVDYDPDDLPESLGAEEVGEDLPADALGLSGPVPVVSGHRYRLQPGSDPPTYVEED